MFAILSDFRHLIEAICNLVLVLRDLVQIQRDAGAALERLEELELSRHQFEAEMQGMLLKAEGKLKASLSSEARERQIKKANDKLADPFADDGEEAAEAARAVQPNDAVEGATERLQSLRLGVAPDGKATAVNWKWGR